MSFIESLYIYIFYFTLLNLSLASENKTDNFSYHHQEINPPNYNRVDIHNELNKELRNAICCAKKMKCCKRLQTTGNLEIRAVLVRCPSPSCEGDAVTRRYKKPIYFTRERDIKEFQGFDEDEPLSFSTIINCRKKLLLTIKMSDMRSATFKNEYIVVDHVYDPETRKNARILTPYVIKLKQEPILQVYGLKFLHIVNSRAKEVVYNKHDANYTGCDTTSSHPTCGRITYNGKMIPYSEGFCCSCDALINAKKQPETLTQYSDVISYSDPTFLLDGVECPKHVHGKDSDMLVDNETPFKFQNVFLKNIPIENPKKRKYFSSTMESKNQKSLSNNVVDEDFSQMNKNFQDWERSYKKSYIDNILTNFMKNKNSLDLNGDIKHLEDAIKAKKSRAKRQVTSSGAQRRGGQNCADRYTPVGIDPDSYHESTHCLHFSDLWYTVYRLQPPSIENSILFQIFEKHQDLTGHTKWKDVTKGKMIRLGTTRQVYMDDKKTVSMKYYDDPRVISHSYLSLNSKSALLLIPECANQVDTEGNEQIQGGPGEYLVVHSSQISIDGDQCDVPGVGFEAFVKQPNRCSRPRGTCLANQPYDFWKHDKDAEKSNKKGCFFLKYYGILPKNPIRKNLKTGEQSLIIEHVGAHSSSIDIEIKADFNTVLRPQSSAKITEVYVDSTSQQLTILTVKITNSGLISSSFMARLSDCPLELPAIFNNIQSKPVLIPPQHQHVFHLEIKYPLPADRFHCSVEALNCKGELVALRRIRLQKFDRCICTWHCLCACVGSSEGLRCIPMSLQHYHAAGFQGSLPVTSYIVHYTFLDDVFSLLMYIFFFLVLILLSLGLCKALVGLLCIPRIGIWGLDVILELPKPLNKYLEADLAHRKVLYDFHGWPIHPDTKSKVRNISVLTEFCFNVIFFFAYPINIIILLFKRICCPRFAVDRMYDKSDFDGTSRKEPSETEWLSNIFLGLSSKISLKKGVSKESTVLSTDFSSSEKTNKLDSDTPSKKDINDDSIDDESEDEEEEMKVESLNEEEEELEQKAEELDTIEEMSEDTDKYRYE